MPALAASLCGTPRSGETNLPAGFQMTIGADLGEVAKVNAVFGGFAEAHALPVAFRRSINVVLDELLTNTVSYGLAGREGGNVVINVELQPDRLIVTLTDNGKAFNPLGKAAPDVTLSIEARPIGGLGILFVRQMLDDLTYHRRNDHNVLVLTKLLAEGG